MKTDSDIKRNVEAELRWDPDIDPTDRCCRKERRRDFDGLRAQLLSKV